MRDKIIEILEESHDKGLDLQTTTDKLCDLFDVSGSVCDCTHQIACKICGSKKGLDGDFWGMIAK